jgi:excisionase family DNA binding protein
MRKVQHAINTGGNQPTPIDDREGVSIPEACRISGIKRTKLYELLGDGTIKSKKLGRRRIVSRRSLSDLFQN